MQSIITGMLFWGCGGIRHCNINSINYLMQITQTYDHHDDVLLAQNYAEVKWTHA